MRTQAAEPWRQWWHFPPFSGTYGQCPHSKFNDITILLNTHKDNTDRLDITNLVDTFTSGYDIPDIPVSGQQPILDIDTATQYTRST